VIEPATPRRLLSNTAVVLIGTVVQRLLHFVTTVVLARGLGDEQFGVYAFVAAYMFLFGFVVDLGFERVITREVARQPQRAGELLGMGFIMRGGLSLVAGPLAVGIAWMLDLPPLTRLCILIAAAGMPLSVEILVRGFFQTRFEMHNAYLVTVPGQFLFLGLAVLAIRLGGELPAVMLVSLFTGFASIALCLWVAVPKMGLVWRWDPGLMRFLWRESWELGVVILLFLVSMRIDQLFLYWLRSAVEVGEYAVAVKVTEALNLIPESVMVTVFPLLLATEHSDPKRFDEIYRLSLRYLIMMILPVALLLTIEREKVVGMLFGGEYIAASGALAVLAWWTFFPYTAAVYLNLMIVHSQARLMALVSAIAVAVNLGLNLLWIPRWGSTGAAAATLVSSACSFLLFGLAPPSRAMMAVCYREMAKPLIAVALTAGVVFLLPPAGRSWTALPLYALVLALIGGIERADWVRLTRLSALWQAPRSLA
jgi:O-antigen/teichoic acid export membrane protein